MQNRQARVFDMTGQIYGHLTVVERATEKPSHARDVVKGAWWKCRCACGSIVVVAGRKLRSGNNKSCGTCHLSRGSRDFTGKRQGALVVLESTGRDDKGRKMWRCRCDCGREAVIPSTALTSKRTRSCGCARIRFEDDEDRVWHEKAERIRQAARERGLTFRLTIRQTIDLLRKPCSYCGVASILPGSGIRSSGIDRIDSGKGYEVDNVAPSCFRCNIAKSDMTTAEFIAWARSVVAYADRFVG